MPTPEFILSLREKVGHDPLPLVGVTAVVVHEGRVILGRRSDNGALTPVTGIVDPGEEPADAAVRETLEEAGVQARALRLALVHQVPRVTYGNGDQADYLDLTFLCEWISGDPYPADGEMSEVGWYDLDDLPELELPDMRARIGAALSGAVEAQFHGGR
ncbi:NUDIX domain-containing protein [Microbacterium sp. BK668]|uniref:NUDIX hydrolase n=1 Tax=Microbacterium sp. BK668 TaxID=2512118 RepID=UPI00105D1EDE|nr:NUDIX domain-containing protein [Microbacterium sp. BK668]